MATLQLAASGNVPSDDWGDGTQLNLGSRHEVDAVCRALHCRPTDVYIAVAMVGDRIRDIRRYLIKARAQASNETQERPAALPPAGTMPAESR